MIVSSKTPGYSDWNEYPFRLLEKKRADAPCLQLRDLTRKTTGRVNLNPSSATSGGGAGTGSERLTMARAASSNAASPDPFTMPVERICPARSSTKPTTICALWFERLGG